jgi:glucose-6-phosphate isomerase
MIDLKEISGLPIFFDEEKYSLNFGEELTQVSVSVRKFEEIKPVLLDKNAKGPEILYYMYRDVHRKVDEKLLREKNLRYDITIIPPANLGKEPVKTSGHYHPNIEGENISYPEVYEVLKGSPHYLLQKSSPPYQEIEEVILIEASCGDKVIIPPNYGHITINPKKEVVIMTNFVSNKFSSFYKPYEDFSGGAYFEIIEDGNLKFIPNEKYKNLPEIKIIKVKENLSLGLLKNIPMYEIFLRNPEKFEFLNNPKKYLKEILSSLK